MCLKIWVLFKLIYANKSKRVRKSFSFSLSVYQLNCLRTSKGLSLGELVRLHRIYFSNTFALVLDSNLHDLNGTNPNWRCFQQTFHGVIYVQKQKFSEWPETPRNIYLENKKNTGRKIHVRGPTPCPQGWGARPLPRGPPGAPPTSTPTPYIRDWEKKIRENDSSRFTIRSRRQAINSLGRADLESVRGSGEGNPSPSSSSTILHHQFHDAHRRAWIIPS